MRSDKETATALAVAFAALGSPGRPPRPTGSCCRRWSRRRTHAQGLRHGQVVVHQLLRLRQAAGPGQPGTGSATTAHGLLNGSYNADVPGRARTAATRSADFNLDNLAVGLRGNLIPGKINYFLMVNVGQNAANYEPLDTSRDHLISVTDATMTFSYVPGVRVRAGLMRKPGPEELYQGARTPPPTSGRPTSSPACRPRSSCAPTPRARRRSPARATAPAPPRSAAGTPTPAATGASSSSTPSSSASGPTPTPSWSATAAASTA